MSDQVNPLAAGRSQHVKVAARIAGPARFILLAVFTNSGPAGLAERLRAATLSLWIGALAVTLIRTTHRSRPTRRAG
jgi:hypothetical protein